MNELEVKETNTMAAPMTNSFIEGGMTAEDVVIPSVVIVQPTSTAKDEHDHLKDGGLYLSTDKDMVMKPKDKLMFVPLKVVKSLQRYMNLGGETYETDKKGDWVQTITREPNVKYPSYETITHEGVEKKVVNYRCNTVYAALLGTDTLTPVRINFKSSNFKMSMNLMGEFVKQAQAIGGENPQLHMKFSISTFKNQGESFYRLVTKFEGKTTEDETEKAIEQMLVVQALSTMNSIED